MKIICNKNEFAEMVLNCYKSQYCSDCVLNGVVCDGQDSVVAFTDVIDEGEKDENTTP